MVTKETVAHLASLARIEFDEQALTKIQGEMSGIIDLMDTIAGLDLSDCETVLDSTLPPSDFRIDKVQPSIPQKQAMQNAPKEVSGLFLVPKVVEE